MKPLLVIGIILFFGGILYGASKTKTPIVSKTESNSITYAILGGFILIIISGVLYLRKS